MATGNKDVGRQTSIIAGEATLVPTEDKAAGKPSRCQGAMSQQGYGWHGNECYPQKLVQLVGYRGPLTNPESWDRLRLKRNLTHPAD